MGCFWAASNYNITAKSNRPILIINAPSAGLWRIDLCQRVQPGGLKAMFDACPLFEASVYAVWPLGGIQFGRAGKSSKYLFTHPQTSEGYLFGNQKINLAKYLMAFKASFPLLVPPSDKLDSLVPASRSNTLNEEPKSWAAGCIPTCSYVYKRNIHNCMCIVLHTYARIHVCVCVCVRILSIKVKISNQSASNPHCGASVCCSVFTPNNYKNVPGERTYLVTWERYTKWISHVSMSNSICQPYIYDMVSSCRTPDWLIWLIHSELIDISLLQSYKKACPQISIDDTSI